MTTAIAKFQRARHPQQIEFRREAIIRAARELFVRNGLENVSLSDIALESQTAKSNIYRYFESREHIYLVILQAEGVEWEKNIAAALQKFEGKATISDIAKVITNSFIECEKYSLLISVINSVLETNLSAKLAADFRKVFFERRERLAKEIANAMTDVDVKQVSPLMLSIFGCVSGLWPMSHPTAACNELLGAAENAHLRVDFGEEMTRFLEHLFRGALAQKGGA